MLKLNLYFAGDDYDKIYSKSQLLPIVIGYHIAHYVKRPNTTLTHAIEDMLHINLASYHTENRSKLNLIPRESYLKAARIALLAYVQFAKGIDHVDLEFDMTDFCFLNSDKRFSKKLSNLSVADQSHYIHNTPLYVQSLNYNAVKHGSAAHPITYLMIHVTSTPK